MLSLNDWRVRAFLLSGLIVIPFLRFLVRQEYDFINWEAAAATVLLATVTVLLALVARGLWFRLFVIFAITVTATFPALSLTGARSPYAPWVVGALLASGSALLMQRLKENFFALLAVFTWGGLPAEVATHIWQAGAPTMAYQPVRAPHVLWLILDEQIGLAGFPENVPECAAARNRFAEVLARYNFTTFPRAYSNYPVTVDSLGSIFQGRLAEYPEEHMPRAGWGHMRHYAMPTNALIEEFHSKGYRATVWQHGSVRICGRPAPWLDCRQYEDKLKWLERAPGGWTYRFRWLVSHYQATDPWFVKVKGFFPFRFGVKITGPLALESFWPDGVAVRVLSEKRPTLFLAHLLAPHAPYLYRRDGSIRPIEEWGEDRADRRVDQQQYHRLYCRYCEQSEYVATALERLLARLEAAGCLRNMTVVIHGDHGPRILLAPDGTESQTSISPELLDYEGEPDPRDLADRFSILLAIKRVGASAPEVRPEAHSLLTLISRNVFGREPAEGAEHANQVFLADSQGVFHAIKIQNYWR